MSIFGWFKKPQAPERVEAPRTEDDYEDDYMECSEKEVHHAARAVIWNEGLQCENARWGGSLSKCDKAEANVARCRIKYANCQPERIRTHIFQWLDYYDGKVVQNRSDLISNESVLKERRDTEAYKATMARQAECSRRVARKIRL